MERIVGEGKFYFVPKLFEIFYKFMLIVSTKYVKNLTSLNWNDSMATLLSINDDINMNMTVISV